MDSSANTFQETVESMPPGTKSPHAIHNLPLYKKGDNPKLLAYSAMIAKKRLKPREYQSLFEAFLFGMVLRYQSEQSFWSVGRIANAKISIVILDDSSLHRLLE